MCVLVNVVATVVVSVSFDSITLDEAKWPLRTHTFIGGSFFIFISIIGYFIVNYK